MSKLVVLNKMRYMATLRKLSYTKKKLKFVKLSTYLCVKHDDLYNILYLGDF